MKCFSTILEVLNSHAVDASEKVIFTWVDIHCEEQQTVTFKQLEDQSNAVAARLLKQGCQKGDRVMIAYPFGLEFLAGMFGAMKIGVIPCSIYPPNPNQLKTEMPKFRRFAEDAGAKYALSTNMFAAGMTAASVLYKTGVAWIGTDKLTIRKCNPNKPKDYETYVGEPNKICFIQYTSGSTGRPKGVMVSHHNLVENCRAGVAFTKPDANSLQAYWVPQYHDMGLVAGFMSSLYSGVPLVVASPLDFVVRPLLWADMIENFHATHTCAPNFAYALLLKRLEQAKRVADWSSIECAMFGAEPAQSHVMDAVSKTLCIKRENVCNTYGLAEAVVFLTGGSACPDAEGLVCCGEVDSPTLKLRIIQDGKEVEHGEVGSIWAQSPRVAAGYFGQPELTTATFANKLPGYDGTWLDTGDLGKVVNGQLYVTGRVKDVIIINGKNYYPTDAELSIDAAFGDIIRPGRTAAFQYGDASIGITVEARKGFDKSANKELAIQLSNHVSQVHGLFVAEAVVLKLGVTPKTTSGKLKRNEIRQTTIAGDWKESSKLLQLKRLCNNFPTVAGDDADHNATLCDMTVIQTHKTSALVGRNHEAQASTPETNDGSSVREPTGTNPACFSTKYANTIEAVFGYKADPSKSWAENGLTSLKSAELRNKVEEVLHVVLPVNFEQLYATPQALSVFLEASEGKSFPVEEACHDSDFVLDSSRSRLSKLQLGMLQTLGSVLILLLFFISIIPAYFLVSWVMNHCESAKVGECNTPVLWLLLPLSFPLYLFSFSIIVVFCKYAVNGTYVQRHIEVLSWGYLQWWFIDRLLEVWEHFVGWFIVETKFIWIFYWLLGADLAWSTRIGSFIREFDLVSLGDNSVISHPIKCRKFSQSTDTGPTVTFRPIVVGKSCQVSGMVSLGASIGDGSKVEKLSVVDEGAQVPDGVLARGNPACHAGSFEPSESRYWEENLLDVIKIDWLLLEAYHYFALSFLVHTMLHNTLPSWRYATILHWFLLFPLSSFLAILTSIALKWLLIGKRDPSDEFEDSLYRRATNWACDFHFRVAAWPITPLIGHSKLWNIVLFLHGLDVDLRSELNFTPFTKFSPSTVDFVKIRKSFVATITFDFDGKVGSKIEIINSSVGYHVNLHSGVKIMRSMIPPRTDLSDSIYDLNHARPKLNSSPLMNIFLPELSQLVLNMVLFASLIPSYEIVHHATQTSSTWIAAGCFVTALFALLCVWILSTRTVEWMMLSLPRNVQVSLFGVYINHVWLFRIRNLLELLICGTPMFPYYAQFMGAKVDDDLWYFGHAIYEYRKLHFKGSTVVDSSSLNGHYIDGNGLMIKDTYVSGVVHPGCFAVAGSVTPGKENGPGKVFLSNVGIDPYATREDLSTMGTV
ncbi:D-alanine--D-alanyl carrier protein ligase [Seminavis robusta]|uniref:D-alanine--D-alanyl carrier protein ligase n=1 Tax=Seminavis robusta TaxID=568900 RepID=A0A9N8E840_9STRA|nr:D-alanine--D-alanyl carrier protein ligase [Seminavis robusta]|eukprot:Sro613_g175660.1 D-alanine--D-alanyl carrier protein ligase (1373) ;mRNA; f:43987-48176